jgi:hypothetical protein
MSDYGKAWREERERMIRKEIWGIFGIVMLIVVPSLAIILLIVFYAK